MTSDSRLTKLWLQKASGRIVERRETIGAAPEEIEHDGAVWRRAMELPAVGAVVYHVIRETRRQQHG